MAVAVASFPHAPQISSSVHAQSAQDALLDALLSSCEKPATTPLKSFGRDLKPYFPEADNMRPCIIPAKAINGRNGRYLPNVPPVASAAAAAAASIRQASPLTKAHSAKGANGSKKGTMNKGKATQPRREAGSSVIQGGPDIDKPLVPFNSGDMAAFLSWAGPGFCVAPSPDKLPLPTALLLE